MSGNWSTCVNEHLIRANVPRFTAQLQNEEAKQYKLNDEYNKGFIYIYGLDLLMQIYEENRSEYPAYPDFYPQILEYFDSLN